MLFVLAFVGVANLALGALVLFKNSRHWTNRAFALFAAGVSAWTYGIFLVLYSPSLLPSYFTDRLPFAASAIIFYSLVLLFWSFPPHRSRGVVRIVVLACVSFVVVAIVCLTDLVVVKTSSQDGILKATYGPVYPLFAVHLLLCLLTSIRLMISTFTSVTGRERRQIIYLATGLLLPGFLGISTNLLVPLLYGSSSLSQYGPLFSLLTVGIIAHAIVRHRLMDMRVVIKKGVVYVFAFSISGAALAGLIYLSRFYFPLGQLGYFSDLILGLTVAIIFHPLKAAIQAVVDRYLYRTTYHYQSTVLMVSEAIVRRLRLSDLLEYVASVVHRTLQPEWIHIYLRADAAASYVLQFSSVSATVNSAGPPIVIGDDHSVPAALAMRTAALSSDAGEGQAWGPALRQLGADLAIPVVYERGLLGFILLGPKLSGDSYFANDLDLLATLTNQAGLAIKNVQLYRQVVLINEHLQNIVATIEGGVVAVDSAGQVTMFNRAAEHLTGFAAETLLGRAMDRLPSGLAEPLTATLRDGEPRILPEIELPAPEGNVVPVMCLVSPLREPTGESLGAVAVFSDLTPVKELETERRRAERLAYFETLAAGIAHEIKNPLVAVRTFVQLLPRRFQDEQFRERFGRVAGREIDRMLHLVGRLQVLAKPGARQHRAVDLRIPVTEALELLQPRLEEKRITLQWNPGSEPQYVVGGEEELEQLFLNLCINALEAMPPGGTLTIHIAAHESGRAVDVEDTGPGVPEDLLTKIFDPFVTTKVHGSGLGLAICASIANAHGATIRASNKSGAPGAVFTVEFPESAMAGMPQTA